MVEQPDHVSTEGISETIAGWATRPVNVVGKANTNAMTVDVEDYFQVEAFFNVIDRKSWDNYECRVERNTEHILQIFDEAGVKATFFTLGWVGERYPALIRRIVGAGHELGSHGLAHYRADSQTPQEFSRDIGRAKSILEDAGGVEVKGYRAASFSLMRGNLWAHESLAEAGYSYSSSIYPIRHDLYGIPEAPRFPFFPLQGSSFIEIPMTAVRRLGTNWPSGGGGFFRLLPYWLSTLNLRAVRTRDRLPCMFYFHPWEIDPAQPRIPRTSLKTRIRHYTNLSKMQGRIVRLLREFKWNRVDQIYPVARPQVRPA